MAYFEVTFDALSAIRVVADDADKARRIARQQLDPDVDWDHKDTQQISEEEFNG